MVAGWQLEILRLAGASLRANKMRGALTILGIVIGITSVVGMVSLVEGLNRSVKRQIDALGSDTITISRFATRFTSSVPDSLRKRKRLTDRDAEGIRASCPSVLAVTVHVRSRQRLSFRGEESRLTDVLGVDRDYLRVFSRDLASGRAFTDVEHRTGARRVLLGSEVKDELFPNLDPLGRTVQIGHQKFEVAGVLAERGKFLGQSLDREVLIPRGALERYFGSRNMRLHIDARAVSSEAVERALDEITESLRRTRRLRPRDPNDFALETQESLRSLYGQITGGFFVVVMAIASVALLVGGIGVMNIMLVSVTERTREIGVRKALGATRTQILSQFLAEAMVLTAAGGTLGIVLGVLIGRLIDVLTPIPSHVPIWAYAAALGVSAAVGLFFGSWPAFRASRLDPVVALRHE